MGYRSEVFIIIEVGAKEEFEALLETHDLQDEIQQLPRDEQNTTGSLKYYGSWLKWYGTYKDVSAINNFIDSGCEERALIAIGEDGAESARCGEPENFDMYVVSQIQW